MIYLYNNQEELIRIIPNTAIHTIKQTQKIVDDCMVDDRIAVVLNALSDDVLQQAEYLSIPKVKDNLKHDLYYLIQPTTKGTTTELYGVTSGMEELDKTIIQDIRPRDRSARFVSDLILKETNWETGYVADVPYQSSSFYYITALDALKKMCQKWGLEMEFVAEVNGNKFGNRHINFREKIGVNEGRRVVYGHSALEIVQEEERANVCTALIGRGRGEEISSAEENESGQAGYGRRITFEDVEWSVSKGDPVNKPRGQKFVENIEATRIYGVHTPQGNRPKYGVVEFQDEEDPGKLLKLTYQKLLELSRPKMIFKTKPAYLKAGIGDRIRVIRKDRHLDYETRVMEVEIDRIADEIISIYLGDIENLSPSASARAQADRINSMLTYDIDRKLNELIDHIPSASGRNTNWYRKEEPTNPRIGDLWFRPDETDETLTIILQWNGKAWERLSFDIDKFNDIVQEIEKRIEVMNRTTEQKVTEASRKAEEALKQAMTLKDQGDDNQAVYKFIGEGGYEYADNRVDLDINTQNVWLNKDKGCLLVRHNGAGFVPGREYSISYTVTELPRPTQVIDMAVKLAETVIKTEIGG